MNISQKYLNIYVNKYILNWCLKLNVWNIKVYILLNYLKKVIIQYYIGIEVLIFFCYYVKEVLCDFCGKD